MQIKKNIYCKVTQKTDSKVILYTVYQCFNNSIVLFRDAGGSFGKMEATREEQYFRKLVGSGNCTLSLPVITVSCLKPGIYTNDFAPIYGRPGPKLGHASLATVFRPSRLTFQPILWENLESPVISHLPITTAVITDACLNTRWHHGAYTSAAL